MPTYEYQCTKCKKIFEELQYISEPPIEKCIYCGGKSKKIISGGAGIIFKGSGFYINDSKKKGSSSNTALTNNSDSSKSENKVSENLIKNELPQSAKKIESSVHSKSNNSDSKTQNKNISKKQGDKK